MMFVLVTVLCNQLEASASDLGDDQSRYLFMAVGMVYNNVAEYVIFVLKFYRWTALGTTDDIIGTVAKDIFVCYY